VKIAIVGSRGIPNNYGGFEQFAEYLSRNLVARGHEVWVCNPHYHPFRANRYIAVNIRHVFNPEPYIGTTGNFLYDLLCLRWAFRSGAAVVLMLGYTTSSVWFPLFRRGMRRMVTNMDGMEWQRSKWNPFVKRLARRFERMAVKHCPHLVSDHPLIRDYYLKTYGRESAYIPYGATVFERPDERVLQAFGLEKGRFSLVIARLEEGHHIEIIIDGYLRSGCGDPFFVIGNAGTRFGRKLRQRYAANPQVRFLSRTYKMSVLNNLRHYCAWYFHGHNIGGTNPSLLEAMACGACIVAHDNGYNRHILGEQALYFKDAGDITRIVAGRLPGEAQRQAMAGGNQARIGAQYRWDSVVDAYERLFLDLSAG
jgi:glycosyltransferase involved in cell wall biosynthesis